MEVSALRQASMPGLPGSASLLRLQSDERLIALVRRGQHAAFEALISRYEARLLSFCRHMLGSKEDAEDVLQEVFTAAFNAILADEREINVRPWLYRIARNRSLNHLRRATPVGVDSMDIYYAENGQSTGEKVLRRESFRQLIGDVQELPETQRTALLLREIDALSYEQIAETMETTVPSVKSLLVRARISLAEAAEARKLSCEEVRLELGEVAEGLIKISAPARRHVRGCERCGAFKKHLKDNNLALAAILPIGPLLMLKKLVLTKLGSTASASASHVAGAAGGGATATAAVGAGAATAGGGIGSLASLGAGALATKAVAGLAAAALVTAGAVEADHATTHLRRHHVAALSASVNDSHHATVPVVVRSEPQPVTVSPHLIARSASSKTTHHSARPPKRPKPAASPASTSQQPDPTTTPTTTISPASTGVKPTATKLPAVTEVTTETTELPATPPPTPAQASTTPPAAPEQTPPVQSTTTTPEAPPVAPPPSNPPPEGTGSTPPTTGASGQSTTTGGSSLDQQTGTSTTTTTTTP